MYHDTVMIHTNGKNYAEIQKQLLETSHIYRMNFLQKCEQQKCDQCLFGIK